MDKPDLAAAFAKDVASLSADGDQVVVIHGGGPQIGSLLGRLGIKSSFVDGLRVTDAATMQAVEMVLAGEVNKAVVAHLTNHGVRAAGISGRDGKLLQAVVRSEALGRVGDVTVVDPGLVRCLLAGGFVPVIAPVASAPDFSPLNVNADTAAGAIAGSLQADCFVLVSDVPGVLDEDGRLLPDMDRKTAMAMREDGTVHGGMIPKLEACFNALDAGCATALILDGRQEGSLGRHLRGSSVAGTVVRA